MNSLNKKVIVITAGGTIENIDSVRSIRNSSTGRLGANIAEEISYSSPDAIIYFIANAFAVRPNTPHTWIETKSVRDVSQKIEELLRNTTVDIFIHSMAVADYYVDGVTLGDGTKVSQEQLMEGKLSSEQEKMSIELVKAPKIISMIKSIQPYVYLVGFKLHNGVPEQELFNVGFNLLRKNRCNLVIGNDLEKIRAGHHEALFIFPEKKMEKTVGKKNISKKLTEILINRAFCKHSHSFMESTDANIPSSLLTEMKNVGDMLYKEGLLPDVEGGTYGNLSIRNMNEFFITGRNVHKGNLTKDIVCKIEKVEERNEESVYAHVHYHGQVKPSIDTPIHDDIYKKYPDVQAILHVHTDNLYNRPLSSYNYPCGTMEERDSIVSLLESDVSLVQMKKHGVIVTGDTLSGCLDDWKELNDELYLSPFEIDKNLELWNEWLSHVTDVGGAGTKNKKLLNYENYYAITENGNVYGLCYVDILKSEGKVQFSLYTTTTVQKAGKKIGKRTIAILSQIAKSEALSLELMTKPLCKVVDYYLLQGFVESSTKDGFVFMVK